MTTAGRFRDLAGQDAYKILGVSAAATRKEISRARRERQRTAHPDHGGAGDDTSKLINAAASVLLDESLRVEYDLWRRRNGSPLEDTAVRTRTAPPPRRPPAGPPPEPPPAPRHSAPEAETIHLHIEESKGNGRAILLVLAVFVVVLGIALWAVSLLLP